MYFRYLRIAAYSVAVAAASFTAEAADYANPELLTSSESLAAAISNGPAANITIIDVRPEEEYRSGHIPGAVQIAPDAVADPDSPVDGALRPVAELSEMLGNLGVGADTKVVLYDGRGGFHAARMFWLLEYLGHRKVSLLNGSVQRWTAAGFELESGTNVATKRRRFSSALTPRRYASADWILERRDDGDTVVIDVRPEKAFAKGHIPWAQNIPWKQNLAEDGTMKPASVLKVHFATRGVTSDKSIVVHCQNGLASAHSYFALRLIGHPKVRTYHRSWSEWGNSDDLPVATAGAG